MTAAVIRAETPIFTTGSTLRHVAVMTATGSIGMVALFAVDGLSLYWVSRLNDQSLKAAVGYASQILFVAMSINIGLTIAISVVVSRTLGHGEAGRARELASTGLAISGLVSTLVALAIWPARGWVLADALHAGGHTAEVASRYLAITIPANVPMAIGMALSGVLRAAGDARRAMYVTVAGGIVTALADPLLIFGLGLGIDGAAWATVLSRLTFVAVGLYGAVRVHDLVGPLVVARFADDSKSFLGVGVPAILTNLATPVAGLYLTRVWSDFGEAIVAGGAIVDRVTPLAFGVIFALTGSVGPVIGQNFGAGLLERVRRAVYDSLGLAVGYSLIAWLALAFLAPSIARLYGAEGDSAAFVVNSLRVGCLIWVFLACIFVANTAFNNLGNPILATAFNWGRATLGTIPFAAAGAHYGGVFGAIVGVVLGSALFGVLAVAVAMRTISRLETATKTG